MFWDRIDCQHSPLSIVCLSLLIDLQEWKGIMTGILSKEASKMQAELDHASRTVSSWQQHKPAGADSSQPNSCLCLYMFSAKHISGDTELAGAAQSDAQPHGKSHQHSDLEAHPLSLPQFEMPQLESGWLVEAVQQRFPNIGQTCSGFIASPFLCHSTLDVQPWYALIPWSDCEQPTELVAELLAWHSSHHS